MAELLSKWINQDVGLSMPIQSFERDFANGYYLGELLCKLSLLGQREFSTQLLNNQHPHTLMANWGVLSAALKNQGLKFDAATAKELMGQKAGAALKLLYQLKMAVQAREQQAAQQALYANTVHSSPLRAGRTGSSTLPVIAGAERSTSSQGFHPSATLGAHGAGAGLPGPAAFVSPKGHQAPRPLDRVEQRRLADNLVHLSHAHAKEKHMDMHLAPFARAAQAQEEKQRAETRAEADARLANLRHTQAVAREKLLANQAYTRSWTSGGMHEWRTNMEKIEATKAARSEWKQTVAERASQAARENLREKKFEVQSGIDEFEKNLERIGAGGGASNNGSSAAEEQSYASAAGPGSESSAVQSMSTKLASSLGSPAQMAKQSAEHMQRIHDKVAHDALARKERDRRRRKVLVEQAAESAGLEQQQRDDLFLAKLSREGAEERALGEEAWRTAQLYEVIKSNAAYRLAQEDRVRDEMRRQASLAQASHYASTKAEHERALAAELDRFAQIRAQKAAEDHAQNETYARGLAGRLVELAHKAVAFRSLTEQALIPPPVWREWTTLFVQGLPLLPDSENENAELQQQGEEDAAIVDPSLAASPSASSGNPLAALLAGSSSSSSSGDLDSSLPGSLLAAMVPGRPRTSATTAQTPKTPSAKSGSASAKGSSSSSAAAASAAAELDSQSLSTEAFYSSLQLNREVGRLMASLRDVNERAATACDDAALEDYLAARNEWSYDIREVAPPELVNPAHGNASASASASAAASTGAPLSPQQPQQTRPTSSASNGPRTPRSGQGSSRPGSSSNHSSKKSIGGGSEVDEKKGMSKKAREAAAAAAAAAAAEAEASAVQPYTSLSFLPPLHPADSLDLSEPLLSQPDGLVLASPSPALQNPLFGALLQRVLDVASGKEQPPDLPEVPRFPLALALLGKPFSGRSTQATLLAEKFGLKVLRIDELVARALAELEASEAAQAAAAAQAAEKPSARAEKKGASPSSAREGSPSLSSRKLATAAAKAAAKAPYPMLLARLKKLLVKSEPLPDEVVVGLVVEAVKRLPAEVAAAKDARSAATTDPETGEAVAEAVADGLVPGEGGFVLLGFPATAAQARLLETGLSGFELPKPVAPGKTGGGAPRLSKIKKEKVGSKIARAPSPPPHQGPYPSALHMVLRLDQRNEVLLRRALGRRVDPATGRQFHLDYAQPTEADLRPTAGLPGRPDASTLKQRLAPLPDSADVHATLPEMFLNYEAHEAELAEWFGLFGTLQVVPGCSEDAPDAASADSLSVEATRELIRAFVRSKMAELDERAMAEAEAKRAEAMGAAIANGEVIPPPQHPLEAAHVDAPNAAAAAAFAAQQQALENEHAAAAAAPVSPSPSMRKVGGSSAQAAATDAAASSTELVATAAPSHTYPVFTGAELYSFSQSGFYDQALAGLLASKWSLCESHFLRHARHVFRALRAVRAASIEYFASTRRNFFAFIRRQDAKPVLLEAFQASFNALPQDLRADPAAKDELHMRLDELGEQLWRVNSNKHEENEAEFARIVSGGGSAGVAGQAPNEFIESQHAALYFYHALLCQLELDRYFQTVRIAQDFFAALKGQVIPEEKEREENTGKKKSASAAAGGAGASGGAGADGEARTGEPVGVPIRGGLGLKMHINLPLQLSKGDPKVRAAKKKEAELAKKKESAAAAAAAAAGGGAAGGASSSSLASSSGGSGKKGGGGGSRNPSLSLNSSRKRFAADPSLASLALCPGEENDPFADLVEIVRNNFIEPAEALEQIGAVDLETLVGGAGAAAAGSKKGSRNSSKGALGSAGPKGAGGRDGATGGTPQQSQGGVAAGSPANAARQSSAGKKRSGVGGKGGAPLPTPAAAPRVATREALLDAQFRAIVTAENRLLSARIRRVHRNALLEMSLLRTYNEQHFLPKLDSYLELRVRGESQAVDVALYHVRLCIEGERELSGQIRLDGENCFVDADVLAVAPASDAFPRFEPFSDLFDPLYATRPTYAQMLHMANALRSLCVGGSAGLDVKASEVYALFLNQFMLAHPSAPSSAAAGVAAISGNNASVGSFYPIVGEQNLPAKWGPGAEPADSSSAVASTRGLLHPSSVQAYFRRLVSLFAGEATVPEAGVSSSLPTFSRAYVDYRDMLLSCSLLDSVATPGLAQLLDMQQQLAKLDRDQDGRVSWDEFAALQLWFESGPTDPREGAQSESRTLEPVKRLKEFFFHLFATEHTRSDGPVGRVFLLSSLDFLLYLCFDDEGDAASASGGVRSGVEKCQLLLAQAPPNTSGDLAPAFVQRYVQPAVQAQSRRASSTRAPQTTSAQDKFTRKDLTKAAQAAASV